MQSARDSAQSTNNNNIVDATTITATPANQSLSRRLLSKFASASGLASKPRNLVDFYIELDDHGRQYSTGDAITGSVRLRVLRPIRITHIVVSLTGRVHVYKNATSPGDTHKAVSSYSGVGRGKSTAQYHGNGLATLFEDECVLCGDGRLAEGSYQFNFELEFPDHGLPSSVDFERGKITYAITAAITRPTTISPVLTYDREVKFLETIDIAPLFAPKARTITLDPVMKRSRAKAQALKIIDDRKSAKSKADTESETSFRPSVSSQENDRPLSPVPSEISSDSRVSSSGLPSQNGSIAPSASPSNRTSRASHSKSNNKTISTTIESLHGGCLRGDHVSVKINVNHSKYMKSMNGVIVTLYRHARVDTQPALPIGPIDGAKIEKQSFFPRSMTGLGGLSLSGAGSAHVFRKDLAQVISPLVINPTTLTAEVIAKFRVPEGVFPTIIGVPGSMISFKYYIEVIVDIQGKLASSGNALSDFTSAGMAPPDSHEIDYGTATMHPARILDTAYVRRDKGVVCSSFELIIGTVDSERKKGKRKALVAEEAPHDSVQDQTPSIPVHPPTFESVQTLQTPNYSSGRQYSGMSSAVATEYDQSWPNGTYDYITAYQTPPPPLTIPQRPDESQMSEKERVRLAEARLLPSAPPGMEEEVIGATAPRLDEEDDIPGYTQPMASAPTLGDDERRSSLDVHDRALYLHEDGQGQVSRGKACDRSPDAHEYEQSLRPHNYDHDLRARQYEEGYAASSSAAHTTLERWPTAQRAYTNGASLHQGSQATNGTPTNTTTTALHEVQLQVLDAQGSGAAVGRNECNNSHVVTAAGQSEISGQQGQAVEADSSSDMLHDSHAEALGLTDLPRYEQ